MSSRNQHERVACSVCGTVHKDYLPCPNCHNTYDKCQGNPVQSRIIRDPDLGSKAFDKLKNYVPKMHVVDNLKWHRRFLGLANNIAQWSKDPSTKCGAIIADSKQRVVSMGYNGPPRGVKDTKERLHDREIKYDLTIHSEMNAIMFATQPLDGCTLYVVPIPPCIRCAVHIIQSGITTVVFQKIPDDLVARWGDSTQLSKEMFEEAGVEWIEI